MVPFIPGEDRSRLTSEREALQRGVSHHRPGVEGSNRVDGLPVVSVIGRSRRRVQLSPSRSEVILMTRSRALCLLAGPPVGRLDLQVGDGDQIDDIHRIVGLVYRDGCPPGAAERPPDAVRVPAGHRRDESRRGGTAVRHKGYVVLRSSSRYRLREE